jgi:hypothetical protein
MATRYEILGNHLGYPAGKSAVLVIRLSAANRQSLSELLELKLGESDYRIHLHPQDFETPDGWWPDRFFARVRIPVPDRAGSHMVLLKNGEKIQAQFDLKALSAPYRAEVLPAILEYFFRQRCSGEVDEFDHNVPFFGDMRGGTRDVHGGWYDASGDVSKYLSHLSYTNFMAPQQIPLVVWALIAGAGEHEAIKEEALSEARHGADFLVRMLDDEGFFYQIVFDRWSKDLALRNICNYSTQLGYKNERVQASYRQGGGMAIAALARAAALFTTDGKGRTYGAAAQTAYAHLRDHNFSYCDDFRENIIDDYAALMATAELYELTSDSIYLEDGLMRCASLLKRQDPEGFFWADDGKTRPFFHASDEGLPMISLLRAAQVFGGVWDPDFLHQLRSAIRRQLEHWLRITNATANPFGYPRQRVKSLSGPVEDRFFFPHENESGYWWQGENARLGSLCAAVRLARKDMSFDGETLGQLEGLESDLENWLLGLNPFDACMIEGFGRNNPRYEDDFPGIPGGICNGITSSMENESTPALCETDDPFHSWRWGEQWIPHTAWWFYAFALS